MPRLYPCQHCRNYVDEDHEYVQWSLTGDERYQVRAHVECHRKMREQMGPALEEHENWSPFKWLKALLSQ